MNKSRVAAAVIALAMSSAIAAMESAPLTTDTDKLSYSIGADLGKNFKKQGIEINPTAMAKGLQDGAAGSTLLLTEDQMKDVLNTFQKNLLAKRQADLAKQADDNKAKGEAFLSQNKAKDGVVALASGLQYKIIQSGTGVKPSKDDTVTVDYTGQLIDGQVFDSSEKTGKPATFKVSQVIPGWTEVLQLMPAGSTWEVYIPSALAYGPRSVGGPIGPNETLVFKIHLISVQKIKA
jgi:FKBP-type peptidyl-prolyl cis-trans isomerase FklB